MAVTQLRRLGLLLLILLTTLVFYFVLKDNPSSKSSLPPAANENVLFGYPSTDCTILVRSGYIDCYNTKTKVADWTSYHMTPQYLDASIRRSNDFRADSEIPSGKRSELVDYRGSGYDRGHLVPAADMKRSQLTMSESFLLTNIAPQTPGFNRGIWSNLEGEVRDLIREKKNAYIFTGPLYLDAQENRVEAQRSIGQNHVAVPTHFYKIIVVGDPSQPDKMEAYALIIPNIEAPFNDLSGYATTIREIERLSGLDFLKVLDKATQDKLETRRSELVQPEIKPKEKI